MSDRRVRRVLATGSVGNLPLEILRVIWQEVHRAGEDARRALRRHIMKIRVITYIFEAAHPHPIFLRHHLNDELRAHWHFLGRSTWTWREIRNENRRSRQGYIPPPIYGWTWLWNLNHFYESWLWQINHPT